MSWQIQVGDSSPSSPERHIAVLWFQVFVLLSTPLLTLATPAVTRGDGNNIGHAETLLLIMTINTQLLPEIVRAEKLTDGRLVLRASVWRTARLRLPDCEPLILPGNQYGYALESIPSLTYKLDLNQMTLAVTTPASAFIGNKIYQSSVSVSLPKVVKPGFFFDYDASINSGDHGYESHGVLLEGVAFSQWGSGVTGLVMSGNRQNDQAVRTESYWRKDLPGPMETLVLGDTVSDGGSWSRPARYAGVRWARNFSLRPGFISMPMPNLSGTAALPSTIDVLINNRRRNTEQVNPGPFELTNVPVMSGAGEINLIVRDLLGRESVISQSYYFSPRLLAKGLSDFSLEAGVLRENYGIKSNDYGNSFMSGTGRYGLTSALTAGAHLGIQPHRQAVGVYFAMLLGTFATAEVAMATASTADIQGNHYLFSLERRTSKGNTSLRWEYFDQDFVQFAAAPSEARPRKRLSAGLGTLFPGNVSAGINYTYQSSWDDDHLDFLTASLSVSLPWDIYLSGYVNQDLGPEHAWSGGVTFTLPLGEQRTANASTNFDSNGNTINRAELSQSPPGGLGSGWRLGVSEDPSRQWHGGLTQNTNNGSFSAEASDTANNPAFRLGARGSVGWLGGHAFATRRIGAGSFAVVKVDQIEDVPIYRSNQLVAMTNSSGTALVPNLLSYQANQLTINPAELPFDIEILSVKETAVPFARSGLFVDFPVRRSRNAQILLRQINDTIVPAGARVTVSPGKRSFLVGKRGEVYLMDLADSNKLSVEWQGGKCHLVLPLDSSGPREPRIGPLTCGEEP